jgi:hypothetical protein
MKTRKDFEANFTNLAFFFKTRMKLSAHSRQFEGYEEFLNKFF